MRGRFGYALNILIDAPNNVAASPARFAAEVDAGRDMLGGALLMRQWGRIGTEGRRRLDPYPDAGAALNALAALARVKRRWGYMDRRACVMLL